MNAANAAKSTASSSRERLRLLHARACYSAEDLTRRRPMRSYAPHGMVRYGTRARRIKLGVGVEARHRDRRRQADGPVPAMGVMGTIGYYHVLKGMIG